MPVRLKEMLGGLGIAVLFSLLVGCEAKLRLEAVEAARAQPIRRTDQFQAGVAAADRLVIVATHGVIVTSTDQGAHWQRQQLPGWPSLIDIAQCPNGEFAALAFEGQVWRAPATGDAWTMQKIDTTETPQAITCDSRGRLWVVASFSTIMHSGDGGKTWSSQSLDEDLFLTSIQFFDVDTAVAAGEFGTVIKTIDGGATWARLAPMPDEFYPEDTWFKDPMNGWSVSLRGRMIETRDGGSTWALRQTPTFAPLFTLGTVGDSTFAAGGDGVILRLVDGAWRPMVYDNPFHLYLRVLLPVGNQLLVAGGSGALRVLPVAPPVTVAARIE
ncbi:MAG: hypothetical protein EXR86_11805 [Gammaproteobacteria bacterium]|nr:hypothetical protein [Gammaproteobacteria bacterium]